MQDFFERGRGAAAYLLTKTEKGRLPASLFGFRSFEINVKNVDSVMKMFCQVNCS